MDNIQQSDLKETVEALEKAIVTLAEVMAEVLRKFAAGVERAIERATRSFLAARLSRWIGLRPARWLAWRWPRRWLPTRPLWRWAIRQMLVSRRSSARFPQFAARATA